jgi:hypothetical protein
MSTGTKIKRLIIFIVALTILALVFAIIENFHDQFSVYNLGYTIGAVIATGAVVGQIIKIIGMLALFALGCRLLKKNE